MNEKRKDLIKKRRIFHNNELAASQLAFAKKIVLEMSELYIHPLPPSFKDRYCCIQITKLNGFLQMNSMKRLKNLIMKRCKILATFNTAFNGVEAIVFHQGDSNKAC
jgi:hypothetical protein